MEKMKRILTRIASVTVCIAVALSAGGCAGSDSSSQGETSGASSVSENSEMSAQDSSSAADSEVQDNGDTITLTDHAGNSVTVPKQIDRIVVADMYPLPSVLSIFFDSADKLVGIAQPSMTAAQNSLLSELYPEILNAETGFIDGTSINIEEVIKLDPDVVFYSAGSEGIKEELDKANIPAVAISASKWDYDAIETLDNWIALLSEMFPENDKTEITKQYSSEIYDTVQERVSDIPDSEKEKLFFLFQYSESSITTSGKLFFGQWWADAIGAKNVGEELQTDNSTAVDLEQIYAWDPSMIFITNFNSAQPDDIYGNSVGSYDWSGISAVKDKQVYKMPLGMYRSYTAGIDTPITLLWLAKTVYPEKFEDIDITDETKKYYKELFGIDLTDEQAQKIFAPASSASAF